MAVMTWLTLNGCGVPGAAGIAANLVVESGLDPGAIGSGVGLAQWAGHRRRQFLAYVGVRWRDGHAQLAYLKQEAIDLGVWGPVCAARDPGAAAGSWMLRFERPRNRDPSRRAALARQIYAEAR